MHPVYFAWDWLVANNLLKDVIQLSVAAIFGYFLARLPWKKAQRVQARNQAELMDKLDASTPGGLGDIVTTLDRAAVLTKAFRKDELDREEGDDETDRAATQERLRLRDFLCSRPDPVC